MAVKEPFNAGDDESVSKRTTKATLKQEKKFEELKAICTDKRVREYIWRIIEGCGVYRTSFTGNSETFFREGRRQVGLEMIVELMKADPSIYSLMRLEAAQKEND